MNTKKLSTLILATLLTGGMLVACGPGDGNAGTDTTGDAAIEEPLGTTPTEPVDTLGEDVAAETEEAGEVGDARDGEATAQTEGQQDAVAGGGAAPAQGEPVVVTLNAGEQGVMVENVEGAENVEGVADTSTQNPTLNLTVGQRYEFVYQGDGELVFLNENGDALLTTGDTEGSFEGDANVDFQADGGTVSFTLTEDLANEIVRYQAGPQDQGGNVTIQEGA